MTLEVNKQAGEGIRTRTRREQVPEITKAVTCVCHTDFLYQKTKTFYLNLCTLHQTKIESKSSQRLFYIALI